MAFPNSRASAAFIESGRVLDVDMATYTLTVTTQYTKKPQSGVSFATPYQHFTNGEGIYFMPEIGSLCWICFPSDGNRAFVLAWASGATEGDHRSNKKDLNPGDIYLGTRDENFMILRRGGVVQIGGGPICQRMFLPIDNTIKDFCENYGLHTLAGDLEWSVAREESTTDGKRPSHVRLLAKEFSDDAKPIAELEIGSHEGNQDTILSLNIRASGVDSSDRKLVLEITKDGNVSWTAIKDSLWSVKGDGAFTVDVGGDALVKSGGEAKLTGKTVVVHGDTAAEVSTNQMLALKGKTGVNIEGLAVMVNNGVMPVMLASPAAVLWISMHTHVTPVGPSGPPLPVLIPNAFVATALFAK